MPTDRWQRVERLFAEALEQPAALSATFLESACGRDTELRDEIAALLAAVRQSGDFLSEPALDVFARQISREGWSVQPGDRIASYTIERRIGAGGMGEVWRARDDRLGRDVAIKLLLPHPSNAAERVGAFEREARAAGTLNHANILTIHDIGTHSGAPYLVTECLDGESLRARLKAGALTIDAALDVALQVARGLGAAHARGIVHRDLKPENIFLVGDGRVKILDFGLATLHAGRVAGFHEKPKSLTTEDTVAFGSPDATTGSLAGGTPGYMAPEQMRGDHVDPRADVFSLGVMLYEMLSGAQPFKSDSAFGTLDAVLTRAPAELSGVDSGIPLELSQLVHRCLAKSADDRFATVGDMTAALEVIVRGRNAPAAPGLLASLRRPRVWISLLIVTLVASAGGWRLWTTTSRARWARTVATPAIHQLIDQNDYAAAFLLARQALDALPDDPRLRQLWLDVSIPASLVTEPAGADVAIAPYRTSATNWYALGRTPLVGVRIPRALVHVRITKPGFETIESSLTQPVPHYRLDPVGTPPSGMVHVVSGGNPTREGLIGELGDYWLDRFEVTNQQFKEFVDGGGYTRHEYWREPFVEHGRSLSWEEAVGRFHDETGQPGPATWKSGTFRDGEAAFPVGGVSWYEAAAYAVFRGKSLPTIHHWYGAAGMERFADILTVSNFRGTGPAAVGSYQGLGRFGTYDMAGNVKEWCSTAAASRRFLAGGAWSEPPYMFGDYDAREPFDRAAVNGFRLAMYQQPLSAAVTAPAAVGALNGAERARKPVADDIFEGYRRQFAYDHPPLNAAVDATEETELARKITITFDAAEGGERGRAFLFVPKYVQPPYQTIVFFPAYDAFQLRSSRDMSLIWIDFILRSGRALLYPIYKGTYERPITGALGPNAERSLRIAWSSDLGRSLDYLETRSDVDRERIAYYGVSSGADAGVILAALEPRLKAAVLQGTGLLEGTIPEIDSVNYAPHVRIPVLMLNGRYDFDAPFETSQRPLFQLLGAPSDQKRHTVIESGHAVPMSDAVREVLPWFDRHLGPVTSLR